MELNINKLEWEKVKFGEVAIQQKQKVDRETTVLSRYVKGEHMSSEDLHLRNWGELTDEYLGPAFIRKFEEGDILYGSRRTYLRKVVIAPFDGITSNTTFVIKANEDKIDRRLLPFVMLSEGFSQNSILQSKGSVNPYVNWKDLANYEFLLPPKDQQARLAELLWAGDAVVERAVQSKEQLTTLQHATLAKAILGKNYPSQQVGHLLLEKPKNGFSPKSNATGEGVKTVSISAISDGRFNPEGNEKYAQVDRTVLDVYDIKKGDIFVVRGNGNKNLCGRAGRANRHFPNFFYPDLLIRLRFDPTKILSEFVIAHWNAGFTHQQLIRHAKSTNGTWKINGQDVRHHKLLVPSIERQRNIVAKLTSLQTTHGMMENTITASKALQKSLINQIF